MAGFLGTYETTLDQTGRCQLPARLRAVKGPDGKPLLDGELILVRGMEGCLSLYPEVEYDELESRLPKVSFNRKHLRYFGRRFFGSAHPLTLDKAGRILVPASLITAAKLRKDVVLVGVNSAVEIWNPDLYQYYLDQFGDSYEQVVERIFSGDDGPQEG